MAGKYKVNETVQVKCFNSDLGIIKGVIERPSEKGREIGYNVRISPTEVVECEESELTGSKTQLHKDAYKAKPGQKIKIEGKDYVVEEATMKTFFIGHGQNGPQYDLFWVVTARNIYGKLERFFQTGIDEFARNKHSIHLQGNFSGVY